MRHGTLKARELAVYLGLASAPAAACGEYGTIGYTSEPVCVGEHTRCELPDHSYLHMETVEEVSTAGLETLAPVWQAPLEMPWAALVRGDAGTVWALGPREDLRALEARQFDAGGELGRASLGAPDGVQPDAPLSPAMAVSRGALGPSIALTWLNGCTDPTERDCERAEILAFGAEIAEPPLRSLWPTGADRRWGAPQGFVPPLALRAQDGQDHFVLVLGEDGWNAYRISSEGELRWRQGILSDGFQLPWLTPGAGAFAGDQADTVMLLGQLDPSEPLHAQPSPAGLALLELDWSTGNVRSQRYLAPEFTLNGQAWVTADAAGRVSLAVGVDGGDLAWGRLQDGRMDHVMLLREDYQALMLLDLELDDQGRSYVLTLTGGRTEPVPTLCRMDERMDVRCVLAPEIGGDIAVGEGGSVFAVGKDARIVRYELP